MSQAAITLNSNLRPALTTDAAPGSFTRAQVIDINRAERSAQESDLVARLLVDDPAAWRFFTQEYARVALGCIRRVLSRFARITNDQDVDEIYARFCFELLSRDRKKLRCFDPQKGARLSTWIGMLATNATYDYLRRMKRDSVCEPLPETDTLAADVESPFDLVSTQQRASQTIEILQQLSDRDRQFVELYYGQGMAAEDIAQIMGISIKTVYTKRHKISARLESILASDAATPLRIGA